MRQSEVKDENFGINLDEFLVVDLERTPAVGGGKRVSGLQIAVLFLSRTFADRVRPERAFLELRIDR